MSLRRRFHHYASIVFFIAFLLILYIYPTIYLVEVVSIFKKRDGEQINSLPVKNVGKTPFYNSKGYMNWESSSDCYIKPNVGNDGSRILLHNLQGHCDASSVVNRAKWENYNAVILYNHSYANLEKLNTKVPVLSVEDEIAEELIKYSFPKTVRFHVQLKKYRELRWIYRTPIFYPLRIFERDLSFNAWIVSLYLVLIFVAWRQFLVPGTGEYDLVRNVLAVAERIRIMIHPKKYEMLITLPPHRYWFIQRFYFVFDLNNTNKSQKMLDLEKLKHNPLTIRVTKEDFEYATSLGFGSFGTVTKERFVRRGEQRKTFAMKSILRASNGFSLLETDILACGNICEGIVRMEYGFVSPQHIHIVMELMEGSLADMMDEITTHHAKIYTVELAMAIETLHSLGIAHRDIKFANIMLDLNYHLKLGDYGISCKIPKGEIFTENYGAGTKLFWAPENYRHEWSLASDWWAFGCIVYAMFNESSWITFMNEYHVNPEGPLGTIRGVANEEVKSLLKRCFEKSPRKRHPLKDKNRNLINISDLKQFMGISIPINRSVSIPKHFRLRSGKSRLEWETVPERNSVAYRREGVRHQQMEVIQQHIFQNFELPFGDFYFDKNDMDCYKRNPFTKDLIS